MTKYPTVYGHCDAGCKRQVVPYDQWVESVSHVRQRKSGTLYELGMGKEYKIFAPKNDDNQFTCTMKYLYSVKGVSEVLEHIIDFENDDKYAEYFIFRLLDEQIEGNILTIIYELAGVRYADTITADGEIGATSSQVGLYGATDVLLYNANAQAVLTTDIEADLSNYYTKSEINALLETIEAGGKPVEVTTEEEMNVLDVGTVFIYKGETTDEYENGAYYVVENNGDGDGTNSPTPV